MRRTRQRYGVRTSGRWIAACRLRSTRPSSSPRATTRRIAPRSRPSLPRTSTSWGSHSGRSAGRSTRSSTAYGSIGEPLRGDLRLDARLHADLDRVRDRILAPLEPATVVDRDAWPAHEERVEPGLARAPTGSAVERDPLVRRDSGLFPVGGDLGVRPHRVVDVAVVLHVVRVRAAVAPDVA